MALLTVKLMHVVLKVLCSFLYQDNIVNFMLISGKKRWTKYVISPS